MYAGGLETGNRSWPQVIVVLKLLLSSRKHVRKHLDSSATVSAITWLNLDIRFPRIIQTSLSTPVDLGAHIEVKKLLVDSFILDLSVMSLNADVDSYEPPTRQFEGDEIRKSIIQHSGI